MVNGSFLTYFFVQRSLWKSGNWLGDAPLLIGWYKPSRQKVVLPFVDLCSFEAPEKELSTSIWFTIFVMTVNNCSNRYTKQSFSRRNM